MIGELRSAKYWLRRASKVSGILLAAVLLIFTSATIAQAQSHSEDPMMAASEVARNWGLDPVVAMAENIYYTSINPAKVGGVPNEAAAFDEGKGANLRTFRHFEVWHPKTNIVLFGPAKRPLKLPPTLTSPVAALPGEGQWVPTRIRVNKVPAIYIARVRPDTSHTSIWATVAWFDPHLLGFKQIAGTVMPEGNFPHGSGRVPYNLRKFYVAGFAGGYKMNQSQGGYITGGKVVAPMVEGKATLLTYPDGTIDIVAWGREAVKPGYTIARQNLNLMVDGGVSQVFSNAAEVWGSTWHGTGSGGNYVWRSGIGITASGAIVYVQSAALSAKTLAGLLVRAGAVKGMALDMNVGWANGNLFGPYLPAGKKINPDNPNSSLAFYKTSERDFVAVFAKSPN